MHIENCVYTTPEWVINIFWVFLAVLMLFFILAIIYMTLNTICEFIENRRLAYLRNKQIALTLKESEK